MMGIPLVVASGVYYTGAPGDQRGLKRIHAVENPRLETIILTGIKKGFRCT